MSNDRRDTRRTPSDPASGDLSERLRRIDSELERVRSAKQGEAARVSRSASDSRGFAVALRLSSEFIGGVVAGGGLGWVIDWWLGTSPWGLIVFVLLGFVAGVMNVMRAAGLSVRDKDGGAS